MHLVGIKRTLVEQHPWLPAAVTKAFEQAKAAALAQLSDTSATKVTLPFVEEQLKAARELMGQDFWSYGVAANRKTLDDVPAPSSRAGTVVAPGGGGGTVPSGHAGKLQALAPHRSGVG